MPMRDPSYYRCCCGVHVHTCTFLISFLMTVLGIASIILIAFSKTPSQQYSGIGGFVISFISYVFLFIGNRKHIHILYWPFLILQLITLVLLSIAVVIAILVVTHVIKGDYDVSVSTGEWISLSIYILFTLYFFSIVYRDYKYVRDEDII